MNRRKEIPVQNFTNWKKITTPGPYYVRSDYLKFLQQQWFPILVLQIGCLLNLRSPVFLLTLTILGWVLSMWYRIFSKDNPFEASFLNLRNSRNSYFKFILLTEAGSISIFGGGLDYLVFSIFSNSSSWAFFKESYFWSFNYVPLFFNLYSLS